MLSSKNGQIKNFVNKTKQYSQVEKHVIHAKHDALWIKQNIKCNSNSQWYDINLLKSSSVVFQKYFSFWVKKKKRNGCIYFVELTSDWSWEHISACDIVLKKNLNSPRKLIYVDPAESHRLHADCQKHSFKQTCLNRFNFFIQPTYTKVLTNIRWLSP